MILFPFRLQRSDNSVRLVEPICECFRISFVRDGQVLGSMISSSGLRGTKEKIGLLKNCTVNRVVCRGIGAGALRQLEAAGITCTVVPEDSCDAAVRGTAAA